MLAGSAAYALGESQGWKCGLENKPWEAVGFYSVISVATLLGIGIELVKVDPIKALFWSAVINGFVAVPDHGGHDVCRQPARSDEALHGLGQHTIFWLGGDRRHGRCSLLHGRSLSRACSTAIYIRLLLSLCQGGENPRPRSLAHVNRA